MADRIGPQPVALKRGIKCDDPLGIKAARGVADAVMAHQAAGRLWQGDLAQGHVEKHHRAASGPKIGHQPVGAKLAPQAGVNLIGPRCHQHGIGELQHLPQVRAAVANGQRISPCQHRKRIGRGQLPGPQPEAQGRAALPPPGLTTHKRGLGHAHNRRTVKKGVECETRLGR